MQGRARTLRLGSVRFLCAFFCAAWPFGFGAPCAWGLSDRIEIVTAGKGAEVSDLRGVSLEEVQARPRDGGFDDDPSRRSLRQHSRHAIGTGDFRVDATVLLEALDGKGAGIVFDGGMVEFDEPTAGAVLSGSLFGGGRLGLEGGRPVSFRLGAPIDVSIVRQGREVEVAINGEPVGSIGMEGIAFGRVGFDLAGGRMKVIACSLEGALEAVPLPRAVFTGADGDIDEYRDPSAASDGRQVLVAAVGVGVHPDGSDRNFVALRNVSAEGAPGDAGTLEVEGLKPDLVALGHDGSVWRLLVQEIAPRRLTNSIRQFRSQDGKRFEEIAPVKGDVLMQLVPAPMANEQGPDGKITLRAGITTVVDKDVRAATLTSEGETAWRLVTLAAEPGCNPLLLDAGRAIVRDPKSLKRQIIGAAAPIEAGRFEGAPQAGAVVEAAGDRLVLAQSDPLHPNLLRRMVSCDAGVTWRREMPAWGGPAGTAGAVRCGEAAFVVFEGGDTARRQHVLVLRLPTAMESARCTSAAPSASESAK